MFFAEMRDVTAYKDAIREVIRGHRDVVIEAIKSGDPGLLSKVYVDPSQPEIFNDSPSPLQIATCTTYEGPGYEFVYKTIDMHILAWDFPTESSAIVKVEETMEEWRFACPSRDDWQLYDDARPYTVYYHLEKQDGTWRIASYRSSLRW